MKVNKNICMATLIVFVLGFLFSLPQAALAAPKKDNPALQKQSETVAKDVYKGPAWSREGHPSLKGLTNALARVPADSPAAIALGELVEAKSVWEKVYGWEKVVVDLESLDALTEDSEDKVAVVEEVKELRDLSKDTAWALKKLGKVLDKLGEPAEAEATFVQAVGADATDNEIYELLDAFYNQLGIEDMPVFIKGNKITFDVSPEVANGRTLVPLRKFAESLDSTVDWDAETKQVVFVRGSNTVVLTVDSENATINGQSFTLDAPAEIKNGRVLVPLRFIGESLDTEVEYFLKSKMVVIK